MTATATAPEPDHRIAGIPDLAQPAGERYFRHPGDVLRLVLWGTAAGLLALFLQVASGTSEGMTSDLGDAVGAVPIPVRQLLLVLVQAAAIVAPIGILVGLAWRRRWRRSAVVVAAAIAGAAATFALDVALDLSASLPGPDTNGLWIGSNTFPSLPYVGGATAAAVAGGPWLSRSWRRAIAVAVVILVGTMTIVRSAGVPQLLLAVSAGAAAGAALLVAFGAPNRRPSPAQVHAALRAAGCELDDLRLERAVGGRAQLYSARRADGSEVFAKVYARDSRDADLLYRSYRSAILRGATDDHPSVSLARGVEREALLLLMAHQSGLATPGLEVLAALPDGSRVLAMERIDGQALDSLPLERVTPELLQDVWREVAALHRARLAHRSLRAANILVADGRPVIIDLSFGAESASPRLQAVDRAELLASLAELVGPEAAVSSAASVLDRDELAAAAAFLQPLALSAATRKHASKALLADLRTRIADTTGETPPPLERLQRVRPRTLIMIVTLTLAFYVLLPQLADVGDSFRALRTANWPWLLVCIGASLLTYVASAVGLSGGVPNRLPFLPNVGTQFASSFVNRVTPANVGGMALNLRFLQKAGVDPPVAVTGIGLNVLAGGIVHIGLLVVFLAWAGQGAGSGFTIPASSKLLVAIVVVLVVAGIVMATRKGRHLVRTHVLGVLERSWASLVLLARSPIKLAALFGGSTGVTLAYISALAAAAAAFQGDVSFAQVGAVYLGASIIAAAAPTPGGLGAMEAALVAAFTGVGMEPGVAVAVVLSYRLCTYWLPILPGWISFQLLERRSII